MHDREIELFTKSLKDCNDEFYVDAIDSFLSLVSSYPESELADDALYNVGLCYFNLNQFEKAIEYFQKVINDYPDGTISVLEGKNEYGKTSAKCYYAIINCLLGLGDIKRAKEMVVLLDDYPDTYMILNSGEKRTFKWLAENALKIFQEQIKK